jgi:hypothetical protein
MYYGMMWLAAYEDRAVGNKYVQVTTGTVVSQVLSPCECCQWDHDGVDGYHGLSVEDVMTADGVWVVSDSGSSQAGRGACTLCHAGVVCRCLT